MLRLFRARACCLVATVVLSAGTISAAFDELVHVGTSHDVACVSLGNVAHDASSHRFKASPDEANPDEHCVGCHLARAPRVGAQAPSYAGHGGEATSPRPIAAIGSARAAALDSLPPRSPPRLS
jgi:hypothetical protein